jgi:hypothetical protein
MRKTLFESLTRRPFTEKLATPVVPEIARMASELDVKARRRLGRSLSLRLVDAGSCNACEPELNALSNPYYDLERFGLRFIASPRHADVLLVTGPVAWLLGATTCIKHHAAFGVAYATGVRVAEVAALPQHGNSVGLLFN